MLKENVTYIREKLINSGRYDEIENIIINVINDNAGNYPVDTFIDEGKIYHDIEGKLLREEAKKFLDLISDNNTTLKTISSAKLYNFQKYTHSISNALLHNYAVAASHRSSLPSIEKIRVWCIIDNLMACAICELWRDENSWDIPDGWKKKD